MTAQHILQLGQMLGLSCTELNADGDEQALPSGLITQALADFGFTDELEVKLEEEIKQFWLRALPPVIIADESAMLQFDLHLPIEFVTEDLIWEIRANQAVIETGEFTPIEWQLNGIFHLHDMEMQSYQLSLEQPLAVGEYQLVILDQGSEEPLGETWVFNPPSTLTPLAAVPANKVSALATTDAWLSDSLTRAQSRLAAAAVDKCDELTASTLLAQVQQQFHAAKAQTVFSEQLTEAIANATSSQMHLAQYLTAYTLEGVTATRQQTQTVEWQDENSESYAFYLWLVMNQEQDASTYIREFDFACETEKTDTFIAWLFADYRLAHWQVDHGLAGNTANGINSYLLRQDNYAAFVAAVDFITRQSAGLVLNQPLAIMQQWLTLGDEGIWLNHEFNELLSIILLACERHACACYYQADDELPAELTVYLGSRGIQVLA